jgi:Protein of unknown function (DUF4238)
MTVHVKMPKRHHYIPEFILWNFADEDDWLHYFDKRAPNRIVRRGKPDELFQHRHLNSVIESDGRKDARLEGEFFGKLDDLAAPIVEKIVSTARAGRCPLLSPQEKETWDRFFYLQYISARRTLQRSSSSWRTSTRIESCTWMSTSELRASRLIGRQEIGWSLRASALGQPTTP